MSDISTMGRRVDGVERIAVLNPGAVGDFVVTLPALHALRAAYPQARIVHIGKQWHADLLRDRPGPIDEAVVMPSVTGIGAAADSMADAAQIGAFLDAMRAARFDLALQMYGGGRYSNPFLKRFGARLCAGPRAPDAEPLDRCIPFVYLQNNRLRMLEVAALVGADSWPMARELEVTPQDRAQAEAITTAEPLVLIHPSASDARRHWPAERFAAVADALAAQGACIAVNGVASEAALVRRVIAAMYHPAIDLSGRLSLSGLLGLIERAALLISNDSGPLHLGLAIGARCVGIYWFINLYTGAPLVQRNHRAALSMQVHCPVCGAENVTSRCPHDVSFVTDVSVEEVTRLAFELLKPDC